MDHVVRFQMLHFIGYADVCNPWKEEDMMDQSVSGFTYFTNP